MNQDLILVGGGGHCKSVIDVAISAGYNIKGILDLKENVENSILDYQIIGTDDDIIKYAEIADFVVTVGQIKSADLRMQIFNKIENAGGNLATIISPKANVSKYATIGRGSVIMHHASVNADAKIGKNNIINTSAIIEHDVITGDFCHISTNAVVNGMCKIGNGVFIGSGSVVFNNIEIVSDSIIGAGSVVNKNILESGIYAGNPVKKYR
jgi:sugar O-acyltransferase (sialic acid O-acetyltransferase NeuD family)